MFINNTRATCFENCPRRYYWNYEHEGTGIELPPTPVIKKKIDYAGDPHPLLLGQAVHCMLAFMHAEQANAAEQAIEQSMKDLDFDNMDFDDRNVWLDWYDWMRRVESAYTSHIKNNTYSVLQLETEGVVPLGEICYECGHSYDKFCAETCPGCGAPVFMYVFRIDMLTQEHGHLTVWDHKTCKSLGDDYLASWEHSLQMWGYCYGIEMAMDMKPDGYAMNFIRKLKTIGKPEFRFKQCPTCRNGSKKKVGCQSCQGEGKVEREHKPADQPFQVYHHDWNEEKKERFVRQRVATCQRIRNERQYFESGAPDEAWPMNPRACYNMGRCPYIKLCYGGDPERWWEPGEELTMAYRACEPDYVSEKGMVKEEMV